MYVPKVVSNGFDSRGELGDEFGFDPSAIGDRSSVVGLVSYGKSVLTLFEITLQRQVFRRN